MAGLSQDELVHQMGSAVSKNAISKYERGLMQPTGKVLLQLANALNVKTDFLLSAPSVQISQIAFRKQVRLSSKKQVAIEQQVSHLVERYLEIEQVLGIDNPFENPLELATVANQQMVEQAAQQLLQAWQLGTNALPGVYQMLEDHKIKVVEIDAPDAFDGFAGWANKAHPVIVVNKNFSVERKRLTALHELAHLLLPFDPALEHKEIERLCFHFAGALLLPYETFKHEIGPNRASISLLELIGLKEKYGISLQALMRRALDVRIISKAAYAKFNQFMATNTQKVNLGHFAGKEATTRFEQLVYRAYSEGIISASKAASLLNKKTAVLYRELAAF